jgi:ATP-dependent DNA helicase RecG
LAADEPISALERILAGATAHALESETLEFKEQAANDDQAIRDIVDAALCFANASGGTVVVGIANGVTGQAAFLGCSFDSDHVRKRIYELTEPPLLVDVQAERFSQTPLLLVRCLEVRRSTRTSAAGRLGG